MVDLSPETREAIMEEIFAGHTIAAIKLHREVTGAGLKESKDFIDALTQRLREEMPDRFETQSSSGCAGVLLLLAGGAATCWKLVA